jgi:RNA methyltransferase, TrmH family
MRRISSRQNPLVTRFRDVARRRDEMDAILLEGEHLVREAIASDVPLEVVAFASRALDATHDDGRLIDRAQHVGAEVVQVSDAVMAALSPVREPAGVVAIARASPATLDDALGGDVPLVLVLAGLQDAGNVGAILRTADACGATGIVTTAGTADPFSWKALRGAMGSTFRLRIAVRQSLPAAIEAARGRRISVIAAVPRGGTRLRAADLRGPVAIVLGGEGGGLPDAIVAVAGQRVTIPMRPPVESLNVAVTAALILYEASQQRSDVPLRRP